MNNKKWVMKRLALFFSMALIFDANAQQSTYAPSNMANAEVPVQVLTDDSTYWTITTLSNVAYRNTTPGAYQNTYKSGGGMIVKFRFMEGGFYEFMLYVQANTYGIENETWTHVEGTVEFGKDSKGKPIFHTHARKGVYRINKNGQVSSRAIPETELKDQHSNTYLWDKWDNPDDPLRDYLLMIDLDAHPKVDLDNPSTIDPAWISKFHIDKRGK